MLADPVLGIRFASRRVTGRSSGSEPLKPKTLVFEVLRKILYATLTVLQASYLSEIDIG